MATSPSSEPANSGARSRTCSRDATSSRTHPAHRSGRAGRRGQGAGHHAGRSGRSTSARGGRQSTDISRARRRRARHRRGPGKAAAEQCGRPAGARDRSRRSRRGAGSVRWRTRANWSSAASVNCGMRRERLIGIGARSTGRGVRALVALRMNGSVRDVALTVLGVPPVTPSSTGTRRPSAALQRRGCSTSRRCVASSAQVAPLWPPGPHALAHAASEAMAAVCGVSRRVISCFVAPDDSAGPDARGRRCRCDSASPASPAVDRPDIECHGTGRARQRDAALRAVRRHR